MLLLGARGFIGGRIAAALSAKGFHIIAGVRTLPHAAISGPVSDYRAVDFNRTITPQQWQPLLAGVDAVVNAVGIFRESAEQRFDTLHRAAPVALFQACEREGVRMVVQLSALGADANAVTAFHRSKKAADDCLLSLHLVGVVMQPSLVFGIDGASTRLFCTLATLPLLALPRGGAQLVQPVHVDDVADAVADVLAGRGAPPPRGRIPLVGPEPMPLRDYLAILRRGMGLRGRSWIAPLPIALLRAGMPLAQRLSGGMLNDDALTMLEQGNTASAAPLRQLLGRPQRHPREFIAPSLRDAMRADATARWMAPVLRWSVAIVWLWTALVSLGLYPVADSYALLARAGVPAAMQPLALYGAAVLDLVLGVLSVAKHRPRWLWAAQAVLILAYTVIISARLPEFWLHPYGPLSKNLPMLAVLWLLHTMESGRWTTSR